MSARSPLESFATLPRRALVRAIRLYRLLLSPWLGNACRFEPTCSVYAIGAVEQHGALAGSLLATARIARCHPWCAGGHNPVPEAPLRLFPFLDRGTPPAKPHPARSEP